MTVTLDHLRKRASTLTNPTNRARLLAHIDEEQHRVELSTLNSRLDPILAVGRHLGRRAWKNCLREDVIHVISNHKSLQGAHLRTNGQAGESLAPSTKYQWTVLLLPFFRWELGLDKDDPKPPMLRRMPFKKVESGVQQVKVLCLKPDEVRRLLAGARSKRDRAVVVVALEGRFRASELAAIRLDTIDERNNGFWIELDENEPDLKTGPREVAIPIIAGQKILREWLAEHPRRHETAKQAGGGTKGAPLFVTLSNRSYGKRFDGAGIGEIIKRCAKRAGLRKIHAHMLRHTGTSFAVARNVNPEVIRLTGGWSKNSNVLQLYVHSAPFFESMALEAYGLKSDRKDEILDVLGSQPCLLCGEKVDVTTQNCGGCGITASDAITEGQKRRTEDGAISYVAFDLAASLGWQPSEGRRLEAAVEFLRGRHGGGPDFARWCLREWASRCNTASSNSGGVT